MKLRKLLAVLLAVLMLAFMAVPAVSAEEDIPVPDCGTPYLALLEELRARVAVANELADSGTGYTNDSFVRLYMAIYEAEVFLYHSNGTEAEGLALLEELNSAIEGLEIPVASGDEIPFTLVTECRVHWYEPETINPLSIVKSPAEMDAIFENIHYTLDSEYPKFVRDEKYNEEFFKENSLVIGLYDFGSGSERQSIDMLVVDGDTLTVYRTIRSPEGGTDDIQWRYALMEVRNSDIEGVVNVKDSYARASLGVGEKVYGLLGDVNNDNEVNIKDATALQKHVAKLHMLFHANLFLADANGDGDVNIKDATEIQKCIADFELESSAGELTKVCLPVIYVKTELALTELFHTIVAAKNQIATGSNNFVLSTVQRLTDEIDKSEALLESENPNYYDVVAQTAALNEAVEGLESVSLDTSELIPLMNEAEDIIYWGGYTDSSLEVLKGVMFTGQMVCLYGQTQDEVTQVIAELKDAMDALVPAPDPEATDIDFTLAQECRVFGYGPSGTQLYLVKSPAEMDEVLATINGQNTAVYTKPERDEKYNEDFFKENSLVISLNKLHDDPECSQYITNVTVKGDTLTVCRTIVMPVDVSNNKNCQYVLLEVANADIEGVTKLENAITYERIICELPVVYDYIPFEILDWCRIGWFDDYDRAVYLVNSPEEMDSVLATIEDDGYYGKPVRDESFNEEYFKNHSLIISMALIGGSNCSQSINKLSREGDEMTLYRTRWQAELPTPDMNFEYILLEVDKVYTKGVKTIKDEVEIKVESGNNNGGYDENLEIYFVNTPGWDNVNIYHWSETNQYQWPGFKMEYVTTNEYGQDIYRYEIPADTEGIVFNDSITYEQTVDITVIKDGYGYYPTTKESNRWSLESCPVASLENVVPTFAPAPTENTEVIPPAPTGRSEISFGEADIRRVQGWSGIYGMDDEQEIYVVRNVQEFDSVLERIKGSPDDMWEAKPTRDERYNDEYFMSKALVVCLYPLSSGSYSVSTDKLTVDSDKLTIYRTIHMPTISTCDMNYQYVLLEVSASDVRFVENIDVVTEANWIEVDY